MRKLDLTSCLVLSALCAALFLGDSRANAAGIEAVKGKEYTITKAHGPWMIMVASFSEVRNKEFQKNGFSAREAAVELVYELRKKGIPAYVFEQDARLEKIETQNRLQKRERRVFAARRNMFSVLAGNYSSVEDNKGRLTLKYIKNDFKADFLLENGARFKPTPGQPSPLSGAFMTINPLLSPEEVKAATVDPLLVRLNTQHNYSLFENPNQYTLVIATFTGGGTKLMLGDDEEKKKSILEQIKPSSSLDDAAQKALELAEAMRNASKVGYAEDYEVYVWHDQKKSVVTIGGFESMDDPKIRTLMQKFSAKQKAMPKNPSRKVLVAEFFTVPKTQDFTQAQKQWLFDPAPRVMKVPRYSK